MAPKLSLYVEGQFLSGEIKSNFFVGKKTFHGALTRCVRYKSGGSIYMKKPSSPGSIDLLYF